MDALNVARQDIQLEKFNTSNEKKLNLKYTAELKTYSELVKTLMTTKNAYKIKFEGGFYVFHFLLILNTY